MVESNFDIPQQQQQQQQPNPGLINPNIQMNTPPPSQQQQQQAPHHKKITEGEADLYLDQYNFTTTAAIVGSVDRKVFVLLRDGKMLFGVLRTFDQYANLILEHCVERIYFTERNKFAEEHRGLFMVRGENVVMLGEVDIDREDQPLETMERIPFKDALKAKQIRDESRLKQETIKGKQLARYGILYDFHKSDMY